MEAFLLETNLKEYIQENREGELAKFSSGLCEARTNPLTDHASLL